MNRDISDTLSHTNMSRSSHVLSHIRHTLSHTANICHTISCILDICWPRIYRDTIDTLSHTNISRQVQINNSAIGHTSQTLINTYHVFLTHTHTNYAFVTHTHTHTHTLIRRLAHSILIESDISHILKHFQILVKQ